MGIVERSVAAVLAGGAAFGICSASFGDRETLAQHNQAVYACADHLFPFKAIVTQIPHGCEQFSADFPRVQQPGTNGDAPLDPNIVEYNQPAYQTFIDENIETPQDAERNKIVRIIFTLGVTAAAATVGFIWSPSAREKAFRARRWQPNNTKPGDDLV